MQQLSEKKSAPAGRNAATQKICLTIAVAAMLMSGCTVKTNYRFNARSITKVSYDPKNCAETTDGKYKCKDVVFTVATIEPAATK